MSKIKHQDNLNDQPIIERRLLDPIERMSEVLFGLIMALTFTCTISVIDADRNEVKGMLIGAIGCNIAWGLVDAVMYLLMTMTERSRNITIFNFVRQTEDVKKAQQFIADALPFPVASVIQSDELEILRKKIVEMPEPPAAIGLNWKDFRKATGIFILVFVSTLPVALPFVFIKETQTALRTSNLIAILMMFFCGSYLAKYAGRNRFVMGLVMSLIGIALVLITIALGG